MIYDEKNRVFRLTGAGGALRGMPVIGEEWWVPGLYARDRGGAHLSGPSIPSQSQASLFLVKNLLS